MFHVEQGFMPIWRRYRRALRQRNGALLMQQQAAERERHQQQDHRQVVAERHGVQQEETREPNRVRPAAVLRQGAFGERHRIVQPQQLAQT